MPVFVLAHFAYHLMQALLIPLLPFIRNSFNLDYTQAGGLVAALTLSYGIAHLPAGWLADRIGSRLLVTISISGGALAGILVGLSPSYVLMLLFLILLGVTGGGYHPGSALLISASVTPKNQGRALGLHEIGGSGSYFAAPLVAVAIAASLGWRGSFIIVAIAVGIFGIVYYQLLGRLQPVKLAKSSIPGSHIETPGAPYHWHRLILFLILSVVGHALTYSTLSFVPLYLVDKFNVAETTAAAVLSLAHFGGLWAGPLGGYFSDRLGSIPVMLAMSLITGPIIYLMNPAAYGWGLYVLLLLIGTSMYSRLPVSESYILSHAPERHRSTALGIYYFGSRGGPGLFTPLIGFLIDKSGFYAGLTAVAIAMVAITLICSLWLWGKR